MLTFVSRDERAEGVDRTAVVSHRASQGPAAHHNPGLRSGIVRSAVGSLPTSAVATILASVQRSVRAVYRHPDPHRQRTETLLVGGLTVLFMAVGAVITLIATALR
jgi:hypothetical protein